MSELELIGQTLRRTSRRHRLQRIWQAGWQGLLYGSLVWLAVYGVFKLVPLPSWALWTAAGLAALTLLFFIVRAAARHWSLIEVARWLDQQQHSQDRLSTAWEMANGSGREDWKQLVLRDAARHAGDLDPRKLLPFRLPRCSRWALLVVVVAAGLGFVPEYRSQAHVQRQQDAQRIRASGQQLADLTRRRLKQRPPLLEPTQKALSATAEMGDQLAKANLTRGEALRELASMREKLQQQTRELGQTPAMKTLERAAREGGGATQNPEALKQQMDALKQSLGKAAGQGDKLDTAQRQLEQAQRALANQSANNSPEAQAARAQMAKSLAELAQNLDKLGQPLEGLDEAIQALRNNRPDQAVQDLQAAMKDLDKLRDMSRKLQQMQKQASRTGKDLAEQLKFGQARAAQQTLQKMLEQLQRGEVSPEQLQQMQQQVAQAVSPGREYGQVGEHLAKAANQLQQKQKADASQSLAQAAKELEKMMEQMADAQDLMATLGALEDAQMAIAMGKSWDQMAGNCKACNGKGCSMCQGGKPGWGDGGKPGAGVGTWADETGWSFAPNEVQGWDNSGVQRPDMDARGQTARSADLNPNLAPTKQRGQLSPGGPMPSITLKGVSIKGQSTVDYEAAAATAQSEAEQALNQDQVPRAYQNTVRDYFDDLRK